LYDALGAEWHKMLYHEDHQSPVLPIAILVDFDRYAGLAYIAHRPQCVLIPPITFEWDTGVQKLSWQQLPLQVRYAITILKCQDQTLQKAVIGIGKSELATGYPQPKIKILDRNLVSFNFKIELVISVIQLVCQDPGARNKNRQFIRSVLFLHTIVFWEV